MQPEVQMIGRSYMLDPVQVTIGSQELEANIRVEQHIEVMDPKEKNRRLLALLERHHRKNNIKCLVFCLYKKEAQRTESMLQGRGYNALAIHGDLTQDRREQVLAAFRSGSCPLMVATDVAARGLDVKDIGVVINYTFPL